MNLLDPRNGRLVLQKVVAQAGVKQYRMALQRTPSQLTKQPSPIEEQRLDQGKAVAEFDYRTSF